jgi:hypothetical protein
MRPNQPKPVRETDGPTQISSSMRFAAAKIWGAAAVMCAAGVHQRNRREERSADDLGACSRMDPHSEECSGRRPST